MKKLISALASLAFVGVLSASTGVPAANAAPAAQQPEITCHACVMAGGDCCFVGTRPSCC
jgi:hypothetical protein